MPAARRNATAALRRSGDNRSVFGGFNLALRVALEMAGIVGLAWWGFHATDPA
jgi:hypothetical protein